MHTSVALLIICFSVFLACTAQSPPLPSYPEVDTHMAIAGLLGVRISYALQKVYGSAPLSSWFFQVIDASPAQTLTIWSEAPLPELVQCNVLTGINFTTLPPPLNVIASGFTFNENTNINGVNVYNWTTLDSGYDFFFETYPIRQPYAVERKGVMYYFTAFEQEKQDPSFFAPPPGVSCVVEDPSSPSPLMQSRFL